MIEVDGLDIHCRFNKNGYRYVVGITDNKRLLCIECYLDNPSGPGNGKRVDKFTVHRELFDVMFGGAATDRFVYGHPLEEKTDET